MLILLHNEESEVKNQEVRNICLPPHPLVSYLTNSSKNHSFLSSHLPKSFFKNCSCAMRKTSEKSLLTLGTVMREVLWLSGYDCRLEI